jgi:translation initiation factor IF-3
MLKDRRNVGPLVNQNIRVPHLQVISFDGTNLGVISREDALRYAREAAMDLVLIAESGGEGCPVAKIMDLGKDLYERKKKQADAKKKQKVIKIKEVKMRPKIDEHDYLTKIKQAIGFFSDGNRVKFTIMFRGRELATKQERGKIMFDKIDATLADLGIEHVEREKDMYAGPFWSRVYYVKNAKK